MHKFLFIIYVLFFLTLQAGRAEDYITLPKNKELEINLSIDSPDCYLGEIFQQISDKTGINIQCSEIDKSSDEKFFIFSKKTSLYNLLNGIQSNVNIGSYRWIWEVKSDNGKNTYRLIRPRSYRNYIGLLLQEEAYAVESQFNSLVLNSSRSIDEIQKDKNLEKNVQEFLSNPLSRFFLQTYLKKNQANRSVFSGNTFIITSIEDDKLFSDVLPLLPKHLREFEYDKFSVSLDRVENNLAGSRYRLVFSLSSDNGPIVASGLIFSTDSIKRISSLKEKWQSDKDQSDLSEIKEEKIKITLQNPPAAFVQEIARRGDFPVIARLPFEGSFQKIAPPEKDMKRNLTRAEDRFQLWSKWNNGVLHFVHFSRILDADENKPSFSFVSSIANQINSDPDQIMPATALLSFGKIPRAQISRLVSDFPVASWAYRLYPFFNWANQPSVNRKQLLSVNGVPIDLHSEAAQAIIKTTGNNEHPWQNAKTVRIITNDKNIKFPNEPQKASRNFFIQLETNRQEIAAFAGFFYTKNPELPTTSVTIL